MPPGRTAGTGYNPADYDENGNYIGAGSSPAPDNYIPGSTYVPPDQGYIPPAQLPPPPAPLGDTSVSTGWYDSLPTAGSQPGPPPQYTPDQTFSPTASSPPPGVNPGYVPGSRQYGEWRETPQPGIGGYGGHRDYLAEESNDSGYPLPKPSPTPWWQGNPFDVFLSKPPNRGNIFDMTPGTVYPITNGYGDAPNSSYHHPGVDVGMPVGTPLYLPQGQGGTVYQVKKNSDQLPGRARQNYQGVFVRLDDGTILTVGHTRNIYVQDGQRVEPGQLIAESGSVGDWGALPGDPGHEHVGTMSDYNNLDSYFNPIDYFGDRDVYGYPGAVDKPNRKYSVGALGEVTEPTVWPPGGPR